MTASRVANLMGAHALAVADAMSGSSAHAALVAIGAHPDRSLDTLRQSVGLTPSGTVRLVDRLAADRLVERCPARDGRAVSLRLTARGRAALRRVHAERESTLEAKLAPLSAAERKLLEGMLEKLVAASASDRPQALKVCRLCERDACRRGNCPLDHTVAQA